MEKLQVEVAAAAAVVLAWFVAWPLVRPWDPDGALAFLTPSPEIDRLLAFAAAVWAIAACCALLTLSARAEGTLTAAMAGAAGLGLRSGPMASLLQEADDLRGTFAVLAVETAIMAAVVLGALLVIVLIRALARRITPGWSWPGETDGERRPSSRPIRWPSKAANIGGCMIVELAVAVFVLALVFRSPETGQIAFALIGSFFVAALIAHQAFPVRTSIAFWAPPLVVGVAILALGGAVVKGTGPEWRQALMVAGGLPMRAALPVHWLGLGCGGALAGMWVSLRMREASRAKRTH